jgi:hypothetical protein
LERLTQSKRHLRPRFHKRRQSFGKDFPLTLLILTKKLANGKLETDLLPTTRQVFERALIATMNGIG